MIETNGFSSERIKMLSKTKPMQRKGFDIEQERKLQNARSEGIQKLAQESAGWGDPLAFEGALVYHEPKPATGTSNITIYKPENVNKAVAVAKKLPKPDERTKIPKNGIDDFDLISNNISKDQQAKRTHYPLRITGFLGAHAQVERKTSAPVVLRQSTSPHKPRSVVHGKKKVSKKEQIQKQPDLQAW